MTYNVQDLVPLLSGEWSSLRIEYNEHHSVYESIEEYVWRRFDDKNTFCWLSEEEKEKAIKEDSLWVIRLYPLSPIGFYEFAASSLPVLIEHILNNKEDYSE